MITDNTKQQLINANTKKELEDIVAIFNLDIAKKNILRSAVYSDVVDKVIEEISARIEKHPGQFSNKELLDYMTVIQNQLSKSALENKEVPTIAIQQNIVNVNNPLNDFDRESKDRMREALKAVLSVTNFNEENIENGLTEESNRIDRGIQEQNLSVQDFQSGQDELV